MWLQEDVLEGVAKEFCTAIANGGPTYVVVVATQRIGLMEEDRLCASRRLGNCNRGREVEGGSLSVKEGNACSRASSCVPLYIHVGGLSDYTTKEVF